MKKLLCSVAMMLLVTATVKAQKQVIVDGIVSNSPKTKDIHPDFIIDTIIHSGNDTTTKKKVNLTILIDGDKITINGKPADKNDPRLKIAGGSKKKKVEKGIKGSDAIIIDGTNDETDTNEQNEMSSDDVLDMVTPPSPPINKAFLGVISEENEKGAKINTVSEGSPAEKAGLKKDDIISKVNDQKIDGPKSLYEAIGAFQPEDKVTITFLRDGKEQKVTTTLVKNKAMNAPKSFSFSFPNGQMPNNLGRGFRITPDQNFNFEMPEIEKLTDRNDKKPKLGISIEDIESGEGVKIKNVTTGSPAEKAGLKVNDIITHFDENKVSDVSDLKWNYLQEGQVLKFTIQRMVDKKQTTVKIEVKIPKKLKSADL